MNICDKVKSSCRKNKKYILWVISAAASIIGVAIGCAVCKEKNLSLSDVSTETLNDAYDQLRSEFRKTGKKPFGMEQISHELGIREKNEWFEKHPPNLDPNYRWTDENRWE